MRKQAIRYTATGAVGLVLVLALLFMVNWLGARHWKRWDWTSSHLYTLSEKTENVLANLDKDVHVVVFMTPASNLYDQVHELLERYAAASKHITVEYIDPEKEPLKTRQLAEKYGISAANTVVFSVGDRTKYVTSDKMAEMDYSGMQMGQPPKVRAFKGEEQFTGAILSLVSPRVPKVYFVTGHGEASIGGKGGRDRSLAVLDEAFKRENIQAADTSLLSGSVPEDADALAIVGPTQPYTEAELEALGGYLDKGGRLLVCLDPLIESNGTMRHTRLEKFLARYAVEVQDDLVVDPARQLPFFGLSAVYLTDFRPHAITKGMEGLAVLFPVARSVASGTADGFTASILVQTSPKGWGETDLAAVLKGRVKESDDDIKGPVSLGVAVTGKRAAKDEAVKDATGKSGDTTVETRLVVYGDSDFPTDAQIANAGNLTLALNTFHWLVRQEEAIGIPPRSVEQVNLYLSEKQLGTILLITLVGMPALAIIIGIVVWYRRRR